MKKFKWGFLFFFALLMLIALPTPVSAALIPNVTVQIPEPIPGKKPSYAAVIEPSSKVQNLDSNWLRCSSTSIYTCTLGVMAGSATFVEGEYYAYEIRLQRIEVPDYFLDTKFTINGLVPDSINVHNIAEVTLRSKVYQAKHTYGYTLTPSSNYTFPAKTVGYSTSDGYNFTVQSTSSTTITISANISGSGASAFNNKTALPGNPTTNISLGTGGGLVKFTITPKTDLAAGTYNATVTVSGPNLVSKSFNISFTVNPVSATTYSITVQTDGNGTASASHTSAAAGTEISLTATAKDGYMFKKWDVIDGGVKMMGSEFTMPSNNVIIKALFQKSDTVEQDGEDITTTTVEGDSEIEKEELNTNDQTSEDEGFNWLWILFGVLVAIAASGSILFFFMRKREKNQKC